RVGSREADQTDAGRDHADAELGPTLRAVVMGVYDRFQPGPCRMDALQQGFQIIERPGVKAPIGEDISKLQTFLPESPPAKRPLPPFAGPPHRRQSSGRYVDWSSRTCPMAASIDWASA